jgi:hypothetical protein
MSEDQKDRLARRPSEFTGWFPVGAGSVDAALVARAVDRTAQHYQAVFRSTSLAGAGAVVNVENLRSVLERLSTEFAEAPGESAKRLTLQDAAFAIVEGATGLDMQPKTPYERLRLYAAALVLVVIFLYGRWSDGQTERQLSEQRRVIHSHGQMIGQLVENARRQQQNEQESQLPAGPLLRASDRVNLRQGPSSNTTRVGSLNAGDTVEELTCLNRWCFVEVLTLDLHRTGLRGWVYQRYVRHVK